ncbi:Uncharacterized conserved protein, Ntn-hydrolase superfamily [Halogranum gelatinilyticum]|uniref:Uncharacterized conserved protein, Ntn-hydrolase superfamily n=1 Tax=Halogranum gelatinilyticum TaxID=660521 RepID=A0A1G9ZVI8_9EURY|nr:DUF1028 domain-containing protein [Halogranum gelatinilyticum]SDN24703.1 Uncharacterized conserved protein, Ntn-hydrolase superfamily [Halogranum gelatinilyticum]
MTFSIAARDPEADEFGVAVTTGIVAVGAVCPYVSADAAVLTQSFTKTEHGADALRRIAEGDAVDDACTALLNADEHASYRQVHGVDSERAFTFTGDDCVEWAGSRTGENYTVAGNMLVGESVVERVADAFEAAEGRLSERLVAALEAGQAAGGDKRGKVSAALLVHAPEPKLFHNLRVDYAEEPVDRLRTTYEKAVEAQASLVESTDEQLGSGAYPEEILAFGHKH